MAFRQNGIWHLPDSEYARLVADSKFLDKLFAAGVDNWEGYPGDDEDKEDD